MICISILSAILSGKLKLISFDSPTTIFWWQGRLNMAWVCGRKQIAKNNTDKIIPKTGRILPKKNHSQQLAKV